WIAGHNCNNTKYGIDMKKLAILQGLISAADVGQDKVRIARHWQHPEKNNYLGSIRPHPGHTLFELDLGTGDIKPAEIEATVELDQNMKHITRKKVVKRSNCLYCMALNKKNAMKKFLKMVYVAKIKKQA